MTHPLSSVLIIFFSKRVIDDFSLIDENIQNKQGTNLPKGEKREKKRKETANKNKNRPKTKEKQHRLNRTVNGPINKINPQQRTENQRKCLTKSRGKKKQREREKEEEEDPTADLLPNSPGQLVENSKPATPKDKKAFHHKAHLAKTLADKRRKVLLSTISNSQGVQANFRASVDCK